MVTDHHRSEAEPADPEHRPDKPQQPAERTNAAGLGNRLIVLLEKRLQILRFR